MRIPTINAILSVYNGENYIEESIASILNQTFQDYELIIVNDGSTDGTTHILDKYRKENKIRILSNPSNIGLTRSSNKALSIAKGRYVARMDADDISEPTRLSQQIQFMERNARITVLGTAFQILQEGRNGNVITMPATNKSIRRYLPFRFCFCHPSVMFRKKAIDNIGGYKASGSCQDLELWLRLSRDKKIQFANLDKPLIKYRIHPNQIKGSKKAYKATATYLFKEALQQRSLVFFLGSLFTLLKASIRSYK